MGGSPDQWDSPCPPIGPSVAQLLVGSIFFLCSPQPRHPQNFANSLRARLRRRVGRRLAGKSSRVGRAQGLRASFSRWGGARPKACPQGFVVETNPEKLAGKEKSPPLPTLEALPAKKNHPLPRLQSLARNFGPPLPHRRGFPASARDSGRAPGARREARPGAGGWGWWCARLGAAGDRSPCTTGGPGYPVSTEARQSQSTRIAGSSAGDFGPLRAAGRRLPARQSSAWRADSRAPFSLPKARRHWARRWRTHAWREA